jgi:hypothetical protein
VAEGHLSANEVELPHAAEALVVDCFSLLSIFVKAPPPFPQCHGVMQPQDFDIRHP